MSTVVYWVRSFVNVFVSSVVFMAGMFVLRAMATSPSGSPSSLGGGELGGFGVVLAFIGASGFLAWKFWRHRATANSLFVCAVLNGAACLMFLASMVYYFMRF